MNPIEPVMCQVRLILYVVKLILCKIKLTIEPFAKPSRISDFIPLNGYF